MWSRDLYIFDFDGTLGDSKELIVKTMMDTFRYLEMPTPTAEACVETIGLPLAECFAVAGHLEKDKSEECATVYRRLFQLNNVAGAVKPFEGVTYTLNRLHELGKTLAIASSRGHESLDGLVYDFGVADLFSIIVGGDDIINAKPDAEPVNLILSKLNFKPQQTIVVGDAPVDILMGQNAGAATCSVTYGNGKLEELKAIKPDFVIDKFSDLLNLSSRREDFVIRPQ